jgi:hypothetical protein
MVHGRKVLQYVQDVRIAPNFGINLVPECHYLDQPGGSVNKTAGVAECSINNKVALTAKQAADKLFYTKLYATPDQPLPSHTHFVDTALYCDAAVAVASEFCPCCGAIDFAYLTRAYSEDSDLRLWHKRWGHRHMADVAKYLGVPLPPKPIFCRGCVEGKSTRLSFSSLPRSTPFHFAPRPGFAWQVDFIGPCVPTIEGYIYTAVFVDGCTKYFVLKMLKSLINFHEIWKLFVARVEAQQANQRAVANLITDSASSIFQSIEMREFNASKGIVNFSSPPYTQELNHGVERPIRTIIEMARSMLVHSVSPVKLHGDAQLQAGWLLNKLPPNKASTSTREELYFGRSMPNGADKARVFGCAAYAHIVHPTGPHVEKFQARAVRYVHVGFSEENQCYKLRHIDTLKVLYSAHNSLPTRTHFLWQ